MKRSASPQTIPETDQAPKRSRLHGFFTTLKNALGGSDEKKDNRSEITNSIGQEKLPTNFTSRKRRESVQVSLKSLKQLVPRSSSSVGLATSYQALSNSLQLEKEAIVNDSEQRRMSVVGLGADFDVLKEQSPTFNIVPKNQILPTNPKDMELDYDEDLPIVIEHEFAPLYKDGSGNLVRPPFINLDPRERYHLLQLKKSIEASEFLQNRLKYMIDPDETTSIKKQDNKVESSTQTYNKEYLDKSLNFTALRTKLALSSRKQRRAKNGRGMFSGDFYYEPAETKEASTSDSNLTGYLGGLSQPTFNRELATKSTSKSFPDDDSEESMRKRTKSASQRAGLEESIRTGQPRDSGLEGDESKKTKNISSIIKLKEQPSAQKKTTVGPGSGFNFEINKQDFDSILQKRNEDEKLVQKSSALSGFASKGTLAFESTITADNARPTKRSRDDDAQKDNFVSSDASHTKAPKPAFSFGELKTNQELTTPAGATSAASDNKPAFSFGKPEAATDSSTKPLFSFGGAKPLGDDKKPSTATAPGVSFGKSVSNTTELPRPKFNFGGSQPQSGDAPETPVLSGFGSETKKADTITGGLFGSKPSEAANTENKKDEQPKNLFGSTTPSFSFGEKKETTPSFSFGSKTSAPTPQFSFGKSTTELKESKDEAVTSTSEASKSSDAPKTPISFGTISTPGAISSGAKEASETKKDNPSSKFSFGAKPASEAPKFLFGSKSESTPSFSFAPKTDQKKESSEPPKFSFGQATMPSTETKPVAEPKLSTPAFSLGNKDTAPSFSFGKEGAGNKDTTSVFSFSSKETTPKPQISGADTSAKPAFSFGNPSALAGAPLAPFSFGNAATTPQANNSTPSFSFGQTANADPALIFGGGGAAPAFNFSAPKELTPFGAPKELTPFGATPKQPAAFGTTTPTFGGNTAAPFSFGSSNNLAAPTPQVGAVSNGGFGSRVSTPTTTTAFGQNQPLPNPASVFGSNNAQPQAGFSFSANPVGNATPGFNGGSGSFGLASRENTPPVFGGTPGFNGQNPGQLFTPPLAMKGRKFAQMRPRKRY